MPVHSEVMVHALVHPRLPHERPAAQLAMLAQASPTPDCVQMGHFA
jgi:hypothetical protein